jgi:hypothetical protein
LGGTQRPKRPTREVCPQKATRDPDTDRRLNFAGIRRPGSSVEMRIGISIPSPVVYRLPLSRRINVFGSNLPATPAVEVRDAKRACTFNGQFFGWGGARAALQNHDLDTCGGMATVLTLAVGIGLTNAYTSWSIVVTAAAAATSMQIGYLIGMSIHGLLAAASSRSARSTSRHSAR